MRAVVQRVARASVAIGGEVVSEIGAGLLVLLGVAPGDDAGTAGWMAGKILRMRIFDDASGRMNLSVADVGGSVLVVSQFTLLADCGKGNRPGFAGAAPPEAAERLYDEVVARMRGTLGDGRVATGRFRTSMEVGLVNDGPVTIIVER